jgi:hypothetical protein
MADIDISNLTEDEGHRLFTALRIKFDWAGTITMMGDVIVYNQGDEPWWCDDAPELTPAMRAVIRESYEWRKAIPDRCAEIGNELAPSVEVLPNGHFIVHTETGPDEEFDAEGNEL